MSILSKIRHVMGHRTTGQVVIDDVFYRYLDNPFKYSSDNTVAECEVSLLLASRYILNAVGNPELEALTKRHAEHRLIYAIYGDIVEELRTVQGLILDGKRGEAYGRLNALIAEILLTDQSPAD